MPRMQKKTRSKTPTFLLELPLSADSGQARRLRAHFEAARCLYNALLVEATNRLRRMWADPAWQEARAIPRTQKQGRSAAFARLRRSYGFSAYALHAFAKEANCTWIADHLDAVTAQTLATRAYQAVNRVCLGKARRVRFRNVVGLDLGPSTLAVVPRQGEARLLPLCEELRPDALKKRRLERKLDRQRRANNPHNYDEKGRLKTHGKGRLAWKNSKGYLATRRSLAHQERKLAAHRKSLHGRLVNEIVAMGNDIRIEKISYQGWQKLFGRSVGLRAPGMLIEHLRRTVANTGGALHEVPTRTTKLSQYCHGCRTYAKKPLSQRWHECACGIGPVQRDLYSAWLAAYLDSPDYLPSSAQYLMYWEGADLRLRAALERLVQRAKEGQSLPRSVGITHVGARLPEILVSTQQELVYRRGRLEALE